MRRLVEAEPFEDPRRSRRRRMRLDVDEAGLDLGDARWFARGFRFGHERGALSIGREHEVDEAFPAGRGFLLDAADARAPRDKDRAAFGRELAADQAE